MKSHPNEKPATPFLKWAGGKRKMAVRVLELLPNEIPLYIEPFLGGGAIFFALAAAGRLVGDVILADINDALIEAWQMVRDDPDAVIRAAQRWHYDEETYYQVRALAPDGQVERAARLLWLNKTCFNGLYRLNRKGQFNVSFGRFKNPRTVDAENILRCARVLERVRLISGDFEEVVQSYVAPGAVVYIDPPYAPRSTTANFTCYDGMNFVDADQRRVVALADELVERGGVTALFHNSDTEFTRELWDGREGLAVERIMARRNISRNGKGRGPVSEILAVVHPSVEGTS